MNLPTTVAPTTEAPTVSPTTLPTVLPTMVPTVSPTVSPVDCGEDLIISSDNQCSNFLISGWKSITLTDYVCNDIESLSFKGNNCLQSFVVGDYSLMNVRSLEIVDCPHMRNITGVVPLEPYLSHHQISIIFDR